MIWLDEYFTPVLKNRENSNYLDNLWSILNEIIEKTNIPKERIALLTIYGSQNYCLDSGNSDIDCECFIFPSKENIVFAHNLYSKCINTQYGTCHVKDIRAAFNELRKSSPNILECFASTYMLINNEYYFIINNMCCHYIDTIATLSIYRLVRGLEGLLNKYSQGMDNPKYLANAFRMQQMITRIINQTCSYSQSLIPCNPNSLLELKYQTDEKLINGSKRNAIKLITQLRNDLNDFYKNNEPPVVDEDILTLINLFETKLMTKYIKLTF